MTFLKWFGWGILWALLLPFLLVAIALVAVLGVPIFFVELVIMIVHFFRGEKCFPLFEEDKKALDLIQQSLDAQRAKEAGETEPKSQNLYVQQNYYMNPQAPIPPVPPGIPGASQMPYHQGIPQQPPYPQGIPGQPYYGQPGPLPPAVNPAQIPAPNPTKVVEEEPQKPKLNQFPAADDGNDERRES